MTQITHGIRSLLSISFIYTLYQAIVFPRTKLVNDYIKPIEGQKILDIGCGTGNILSYLPTIEYIGIDTSADYIKTAKKRYPHRGEFRNVSVENFSVFGLNNFDTVLSVGVLHHITDQEIKTLFQAAKQVLKPGGRFIAAEPCYCEEQSFLAKWIIAKDRGQNVKEKQGYLDLAQSVFSQVKYTIRHDLLRIPYTLIVLECC